MSRENKKRAGLTVGVIVTIAVAVTAGAMVSS